MEVSRAMLVEWGPEAGECGYSVRGVDEEEESDEQPVGEDVVGRVDCWKRRAMDGRRRKHRSPGVPTQVLGTRRT